MQPPSAFAGPWISCFSQSQSLLWTEFRSRRLTFSPACSLNQRDPVFRGSPSVPQRHTGENANREYRHELRAHYNSYRDTGSPNRNSTDFLNNFSCPLKRNEHVSLPSKPTRPNLSASGDYHPQATHVLSNIGQIAPDDNAEAARRLLQQPYVIGPVKRRNAFFLAIPQKYLRSHEAFHPLPTSVNVHLDSNESLTSLRQDCPPFLAAWQAIPLHADEVWPLLGLGENNSLSVLLPPACRGHKNALRAWKKLFSLDLTPRRKHRNFQQRFTHERAANAALSYIFAEQNRWKRLAPSAPPWCDAVQLLETGCWVYNNARIPLAAAPVARVVRRNENDFWMWGASDTILLAKAEDVFEPSSGSQCRFQPPEARNELGMLSWIEAQFAMLCSGQHIRFADVAWYATLGGVSVFRVKRDDSFLQAGLEAMETFVVQCVDQGLPPHAGFEQGERFQRMTGRILAGLRNVDRLSHVPADVAETRLMEWRRRMNDWETKRSQRPFF